MSEMVERVVVAISSEMGINRNNPVCHCAAREALAAMREPTEAMIEEGRHAGAGDFAVGKTDAREVWVTMIDAALDIPDPEPVE